MLDLNAIHSAQTKTEFLAIWKVLSQDPNSSVYLKDEALSAMRRLCTGFTSYSEATGFQETILKPALLKLAKS
jgi:hypothetical protein